jgi:hypothetical protein
MIQEKIYISIVFKMVFQENYRSVTTTTYYNNVGEIRNAYRILVGKPEGKSLHLEY